MKKENCLFCKIVAGEIPAHRIYEDENVMVILDIFPPKLHRGMCLVLPKGHFGSYYADRGNEDIVQKCVEVATRVSRAIDQALGSIRTCLVFEGMEIDHLHVKLYPIYADSYPNYLSTLKDNDNKGIRMSDGELAMIAKKIKENI